MYKFLINYADINKKTNKLAGLGTHYRAANLLLLNIFVLIMANEQMNTYLL